MPLCTWFLFLHFHQGPHEFANRWALQVGRLKPQIWQHLYSELGISGSEH